MNNAAFPVVSSRITEQMSHVETAAQSGAVADALSHMKRMLPSPINGDLIDCLLMYGRPDLIVHLCQLILSKAGELHHDDGGDDLRIQMLETHLIQANALTHWNKGREAQTAIGRAEFIFGLICKTPENSETCGKKWACILQEKSLALSALGKHEPSVELGIQAAEAFSSLFQRCRDSVTRQELLIGLGKTQHNLATTLALQGLTDDACGHSLHAVKCFRLLREKYGRQDVLRPLATALYSHGTIQHKSDPDESDRAIDESIKIGWKIIRENGDYQYADRQTETLRQRADVRLKRDDTESAVSDLADAVEVLKLAIHKGFNYLHGAFAKLLKYVHQVRLALPSKDQVVQWVNDLVAGLLRELKAETMTEFMRAEAKSFTEAIRQQANWYIDDGLDQDAYVSLEAQLA